jgi:hypothetical protein
MPKFVTWVKNDKYTFDLQENNSLSKSYIATVTINGQTYILKFVNRLLWKNTWELSQVINISNKYSSIIRYYHRPKDSKFINDILSVLDDILYKNQELNFRVKDMDYNPSFLEEKWLQEGKVKRSGYVYFYYAPKMNLTKIGFSSKPNSRINEIKKQIGTDAYLRMAIPTKWSHMEKVMHDYFLHKHRPCYGRDKTGELKNYQECFCLEEQDWKMLKEKILPYPFSNFIMDEIQIWETLF